MHYLIHNQCRSSIDLHTTITTSLGPAYHQVYYTTMLSLSTAWLSFGGGKKSALNKATHPGAHLHLVTCTERRAKPLKPRLVWSKSWNGGKHIKIKGTICNFSQMWHKKSLYESIGSAIVYRFPSKWHLKLNKTAALTKWCTLCVAVIVPVHTFLARVD